MKRLAVNALGLGSFGGVRYLRGIVDSFVRSEINNVQIVLWINRSTLSGLSYDLDSKIEVNVKDFKTKVSEVCFLLYFFENELLNQEIDKLYCLTGLGVAKRIPRFVVNQNILPFDIDSISLYKNL